MNADTIYALSSGSVPAGLAVIRLSGRQSLAALQRLTGAGEQRRRAAKGLPRQAPPPRLAKRVVITDAGGGEVLDEGLALWFPAPASFTGEDVVELHLHGGRAVILAVLEALARCPGLRMAEPGEFTRRAFENGKLDLTAAEGLADLISAETEAQRRQALRQMRGDLGRIYENWRQRLLKALAHLEASIDFSDDDLPEGIADQVCLEVAELDAEIAAHLRDQRRGERLRDGVHLAIIGPPNAGKSSLLNWLARRDAAIVSATAGTTRDVIEAHLDLGGYPAVVSDTAGLREGGDEIEAEGVRRARGRARDADLKLAVLDAQTWPRVDPCTAELIDENSLVAINKSDLAEPPPPLSVNGRPGFAISVRTGAGLNAFLAAIAEEVAARCRITAAPAVTRVRHRQALEDCRQALTRSLRAEAPELAGEDLRLAVRCLGRITGRVDVEDILDVVFKDFCIGK
ncbi:MAG: tRNA uridine-5-carboxymethylaminomethyl(34) synthesis GTPase MnmE [Rhodospirillales bacterium]|jgi:tRNA modification GTPase|nr:tRNA uridine-5-carboxymethylaminomethyl(34) synthesis GTPase MnmE [Rhodospirillales bacterium]HIJ43672.1 tRNA uridine-5-carboxymethylaminomethyl(34) synthesis GTPase MnmE [Rhodospirillaceae bacterium]MDP7099439.1 tRNA uridine-5-carboxymethylaminomethyl(34) synthesis GTPase MnmE [Rhodospirillales bacterium]MDP7215069.1 tRNA uridine-5-carboxymethylaminomethyl(34) synthesis GTPase MnmE [Rhodospirillales bacterium]HIJ44795.1 tRNA uridine-5-carboxymethylaminomethyl(34) synthesis GTPase MnmE [Rhod